MPTPKKRPLSPGDFVQAACTRCKEDLRHTIVALVDGRPVRVSCNTCGGEHAYHSAAGAVSSASEKRPAPRRSAPAPSGRPSRARQTSDTLAQEWATQIAAAGGRERRSYSSSGKFKTGDVVEHPTFGAGVIQRVPEPGKILVLFSVGAKTLVCGKG